MTRPKYSYLLIIFLFYLKAQAQSPTDKIADQAGFEIHSVNVKNDTIVYLQSKGADKDKIKPLIVFVQGSRPIPLLFKDDKGVGTIIPFNFKDYSGKYNFVIIARKGIPLIGEYGRDENGYLDANQKVPYQYRNNDNLQYRVFQLEQVLKDIKGRKIIEGNKLFLIGHSEGYRVVAKYAEKDKIAGKYVFMSADPFNRVAEDVARDRLECFFSNEDVKYQENIDSQIKDYNELIKQHKPDDLDFKNWSSYNSSLTYTSLKKVNKQSLIVYGTDDIVSFHNDVLNFLLDKKFFKIMAIPDLDHNYFKQEYDAEGNPKEKSFHWDEVFKTVVDWLEEN